MERMAGVYSGFTLRDPTLPWGGPQSDHRFPTQFQWCKCRRNYAVGHETQIRVTQAARGVEQAEMFLEKVGERICSQTQALGWLFSSL